MRCTVKLTLMCCVLGYMVGVGPNCSGDMGSKSTSTGRAVAHTANSRSPREEAGGVERVNKTAKICGYFHLQLYIQLRNERFLLKKAFKAETFSIVCVA